MLAHRGACEVHQIAFARDADEAEIAGAAAHVADQHRLAIEELFARLRQVVGDPRIERRRGLLQQRQFLQSGIARGHHGEFARLFVERRRHGEDNVLFSQRRPHGAVPFLAEFADETRRNLHRREHAAGLLRIPRQDLRGAIDIGIRKPRFRRVHQPRGNNRALFARVHAHRLAIFEEEERWQRASRLDAPGRYQLRRLKDVQRRKLAVIALAFVDVGQRGVGRAEVDANLHAFTFSRTLNSSFHRRPSRATHQSCSMPVSVTAVSNDTGTTSDETSPAGKLTSMGESSSNWSP